MKKTILSFMLLIFTMGAFAQNASMQKTAKAVFTLTTFNKDGSLKASSHGIFVSADGQAVSTWAPFSGADHAIVIDAQGKQHKVETIIGANELYDVCKFTISGTTLPAPIAENQATGKAFLVGYGNPKASIKALNIQKVEKFMGQYNYYIFSQDAPENMNGCPFVNERAQVIGLLQHGKQGEVYATDVRLANSLKANAFSINDPVLRTCAIRTALPEKQDEALLTMMMTGETTDSLKREAYIDDFIKRFPTATEGYSTKAMSYVNAGKYTEADKMMQTAIERATKKDEAHSEYAKVILQKQIYHPDNSYPAWTLDKALEEAQKAENIKAAAINGKISTGNTGLWLKEKNSIINVREMLPDHTLLGIKIWERNDKNELTQAAEAESAVLNPDGSWQLKNIRRSILGEDKVEVSTITEENWPISVKRNLMDVLLVKPDQMSVGELTTYIDHLEKNNQNTQVYAIAWWRKLVYPIAAWVMALVAFAFTPQTTRHGNMGLKLFGGICLGLLFHFAGRLFGFTSQLYGVPPFLAGALPTVLFALLAVYLIRRQEKR